MADVEIGPGAPLLSVESPGTLTQRRSHGRPEPLLSVYLRRDRSTALQVPEGKISRSKRTNGFKIRKINDANDEKRVKNVEYGIEVTDGCGGGNSPC